MNKRAFMPVTEFVEVMERAGRNGTRAHLPPAVVRHILAHPAWREFLAERQKEMVSQWEEQQPAAPSSAPTGSGIAANGTSGASAGTMTPELMAAVGRAAEARALEVEAQAPRRRKR